MKKAEEQALKVYPKVYSTVFEKFEFDINAGKRKGYIKGYEQAEKELVLTWEDIKDIDEWISAIQTSDGLFGRDLYEEVLKQFNESKKQ